jgi:hypothetical protein
MPVCVRWQKAAEVASGKVEEATAVASAAYHGLPIFWQATIRLVGITAGAIIASQLIVRFLNWAAEDVGEAADDASKAGASEDVKERGPFLRVAEAGLGAAHRPVTLLLPAATTILALRETSRWLEVLVDLHDDHLPRFAAYVARNAINGFGMLDDVALAGSKVALTILGFWFVIAWKDRLIDMAIDSHRTSEKMDRILRPFNTLLTWALGAAGILQVLHCVGINIQPLLAAGGVSGIALGFGAQKLTQNVLSGAKLFLTQPFVVGESVQLLGSGGSEVVSGIVESVDPMNTIVRRDDGVPVIIPNAAAAEYLVANQSRSKGSASKGSASKPLKPLK